MAAALAEMGSPRRCGPPTPPCSRPELTWAPSYALVTTMAMRPDQPLDSARFVREEVVDVLAEAMWALLCADRWPGVRRHDAGGPAAGSPAAQDAAQARPRAPCGATAATRP